MPVRTAYAGTAAAGDVYTAANHARMPGGWIGYAETATAQTAITTEVDLTSLTVTVTVNTSRRIKVTGRAQVQQNTSAAAVTGFIKEDTVTVGRWLRKNMAAADVEIGEASVILTPSAGSHTYKLTLQTTAGTCETTAGTAANGPHWILVEDMGPAT